MPSKMREMRASWPLAVALLLAAVRVHARDFLWSDCGLRNASVHFENVSLAPDPIHFAAPLRLGARLKVDVDVKTGARARLTVWRVVNVLWMWPMEVRLGCLSGYGSC